MVKNLINIIKKFKSFARYSLLSFIIGCSTELIAPVNVPPYTEIIRPKNNQIFNIDSVKIEWNGYDVDGEIIGYSFRLDSISNINSIMEYSIIRDYTQDTIKTFNDLANGYYKFEVRAQDNYGDYDPSPAFRYFFIKKD